MSQTGFMSMTMSSVVFSSLPSPWIWILWDPFVKKYAGILWCIHVNMDQYLKGMLPTFCEIHQNMLVGTLGTSNCPDMWMNVWVWVYCSLLWTSIQGVFPPHILAKIKWLQKINEYILYIHIFETLISCTSFSCPDCPSLKYLPKHDKKRVQWQDTALAFYCNIYLSICYFCLQIICVL